MYLCAFWSLGVQVRGLFGHAGILPVTELLTAASRWIAAQTPGASKFFVLPTLFWWNSSDAMLVGTCVAGVVASLLLLAGVAPAALLALLWFLYLSILNVGQTFLAFQWDALLVETGFLAIFFAPLAWTMRRNASEPPAIARWLMWWLLFRLMLGSGIVKLASGDPTWRNLTALSLHYETQPLPTPLAWYAWLMPLWLHKITTGATLAIELIAPWFIAVRRARPIVCGLFVGLQLIIALTGNYAFFNLLTIALSLTLLDDRRTPTQRWTAVPAIVAATLTVPISLTILASQAGIDLPARRLLTIAEPIVGPFRIVNAYGLFAVMTTTRPELIVEGTADGIVWKPYVFKYKPAPDHATLAWVAPHQPRLDWQMWFAALGDYDTDPWFDAFRQRLIEGSPDVVKLLASNPFPDHPPVRIRVTRRIYRFATRDERRASGSVWRESSP